MPNQKQITITGLSMVTRNGQRGPFNIYRIQGNDGITYETTNESYYSQRRQGEVLQINYDVTSNTGANGKVYTNYRLVTPGAQSTGNSNDVMGALRKLYERINVMEKNIIAAIELQASGTGVDTAWSEENPLMPTETQPEPTQAEPTYQPVDQPTTSAATGVDIPF